MAAQYQVRPQSLVRSRRDHIIRRVWQEHNRQPSPPRTHHRNRTDADWTDRTDQRGSARIRHPIRRWRHRADRMATDDRDDGPADNLQHVRIRPQVTQQSLCFV